MMIGFFSLYVPEVGEVVVLDEVEENVVARLVPDGEIQHLVICRLKFSSLGFILKWIYRMTRLLVQNCPLTSKVKFRFGLARPGQGRPKWNFTFEVNGRFCSRRLVTL